MIEMIYYIAARNLMKWSPEVRERLLDKLGAYERECVTAYCARIQESEERFSRSLDELAEHIRIALKPKGVTA